MGAAGAGPSGDGATGLGLLRRVRRGAGIPGVERQVSGPQAEAAGEPDPQAERQVSGPQAERRAPDPRRKADRSRALRRVVRAAGAGPQAERQALGPSGGERRGAGAPRRS
ncbi:unnamed protein product, partial [Staurois parvus]